MQLFDKIYINGAWSNPLGNGSLDVMNPATEKLAGRIPVCSATDVDKAVSAARAAFAGWSATPLAERLSMMTAIVAKMKQESDNLAATISAEMGAPLKMAGLVQVGLPIGVMESYNDIATNFSFEVDAGKSLIVKEAVGVCAFITPWNYPLHQVVGKVAPALAAGCTMVLKPSELAPLSAFLFAQILHEVGLPAGVFNLVSGDGPSVGEPLVSHAEIDMVSFTGSTRAGIRVAELAAKTVKRVTQELGGKSANIILPDADFNKAVTAGVRNVCFNSGQTCTALTRMLVPAERQEEVAGIARQVAEATVLGDPSEKTTQMGPLVSAAQKERVLGYIHCGIEEGAKLVSGGEDTPLGLEAGYYVKPTIFSEVTSQMTIAQEEIFGPVLSIIPYESEQQAVTIANDSLYGLGGSVWSADPEHAKAVARKLRAGQVTLNGARFDPIAPFGGYKRSGNGRELGSHGLEEFLEIKALLL